MTEKGTASTEENEKFSRQTGLYDPAIPDNQMPVIIGGAGSGGSLMALGLAKMGVKQITVYDDDTVEDPNLSNQLYSIVGTHKVIQLDALCQTLAGSGIVPRLERLPAGFENNVYSEFIYISAIDTMKGRSEVWQHLWKMGKAVKYYVDARMGGNICRVIALDPSNPAHVEYYQSTLYSDDSSDLKNEDARRLSDTPCNARSIIYSAMQCATLVVASVRNAIILNDRELHDTTIDLENMLFLSTNPIEREEDADSDPSGEGVEAGENPEVLGASPSDNA